jgi:hypothetical protein
MNEYKTKRVPIEVDDPSMSQIMHLLPYILPEHDEPGWEVCSTVIAQFNTSKPVMIGIVYRKVI